MIERMTFIDLSKFVKTRCTFALGTNARKTKVLHTLVTEHYNLEIKIYANALWITSKTPKTYTKWLYFDTYREYTLY